MNTWFNFILYLKIVCLVELSHTSSIGNEALQVIQNISKNETQPSIDRNGQSLPVDEQHEQYDASVQNKETNDKVNIPNAQNVQSSSKISNKTQDQGFNYLLNQQDGTQNTSSQSVSNQGRPQTNLSRSESTGDLVNNKLDDSVKSEQRGDGVSDQALVPAKDDKVQSFPGKGLVEEEPSNKANAPDVTNKQPVVSNEAENRQSDRTVPTQQDFNTLNKTDQTKENVQTFAKTEDKQENKQTGGTVKQSIKVPVSSTNQQNQTLSSEQKSVAGVVSKLEGQGSSQSQPAQPMDNTQNPDISQKDQETGPKTSDKVMPLKEAMSRPTTFKPPASTEGKISSLPSLPSSRPTPSFSSRRPAPSLPSSRPTPSFSSRRPAIRGTTPRYYYESSPQSENAIDEEYMLQFDDDKDQYDNAEKEDGDNDWNDDVQLDINDWNDKHDTNDKDVWDDSFDTNDQDVWGDTDKEDWDDNNDDPNMVDGKDETDDVDDMYYHDDFNGVADKTGDFWDEPMENRNPFIKDKFVVKKTQSVDDRSMMGFYSWVLCVTILMMIIFVLFTQHRPRCGRQRTRSPTISAEEGKSLMQNIYS